MSETLQFRPSIFRRIWNVVVGCVLCSTCAGAPVGLYLFAVALLRQVVFTPDSIAVKPFGGTIRADQVKRWGRYVYQRAADRNRHTSCQAPWVDGPKPWERSRTQAAARPANKIASSKPERR